MNQEQFRKAFKQAVDVNVLVFDQNAPPDVFTNRLYWLVAQVDFGLNIKEAPRVIYLSYDISLEKGLNPSVTDFCFTQKLMIDDPDFQKILDQISPSNAKNKKNWALLEFQNNIYGLAGV